MKFIHGLILGIVIMYILNEVKDKCLLGLSENKILKTIILVLTRQAARWSTAAKQDKNSMIAVLHANYGAGYLWALKDIASSEQIKAATGIDLLKFEREIVSTQDMATKKMAKLCPKYAPESTYLTKIGGEG
jgi:hypothetical protein